MTVLDYRNGVGILVIQFPSADRRAIWENAFIKAKTLLSTHYILRELFYKSSSSS